MCPPLSLLIIMSTSMGLAAATTTAPGNSIIHTVVVGSNVTSQFVQYTPNNITAKTGDIIQFQFNEDNHTVTQSSFDDPCTPIKDTSDTAPGIHSGFVPVSTKAQKTLHTFDVQVNSTDAMYFYCAQQTNCQEGMVFTVNSGAIDHDFYKSAAAKAANNVPAKEVKGGIFGTIAIEDAVLPPQ